MSYTPFLVDQILRGRPAFVANSTAGAQFLRHVFALQADQVRIIRNAYAPESGENACARQGEQHSGGTILLHLANLFPEKDLETVLEAIRQLKAGGLRCRLHVAGRFMDRRYRKKITGMVASMDIGDCVRFHGTADRPTVRALLDAADIGLLSSRSEGMPNSVMEYMYAGLPVLATDIPGVRDVAGGDNTAWLFSPGDASGLRDLIVRLAPDRELRKRLGDANRSRIVNEFGVDKIMQQWSAFLRGL
jgi:glycosyltransferase involved in cell wall biosynthesis